MEPSRDLETMLGELRERLVALGSGVEGFADRASEAIEALDGLRVVLVPGEVPSEELIAALLFHGDDGRRPIRSIPIPVEPLQLPAESGKLNRAQRRAAEKANRRRR